MRALLAAQAFARREAAAMGRRPLGGVTAEEEGSRIELRLGLSDTLQAQSRLPEAEVLIVAALQWRERHLGAQAAETLATCFDLARCKRRAAREAPGAWEVASLDGTSKSTESESVRHFETLYRVSKTLFDVI